MQRRHVLKSILSLPAITALPAAAQTKAPEKPAELKPPPVEEVPKLQMTNAEAAVAGEAPRFFSEKQFSVLVRLCGIMVPASAGKPGAKEAGVPEFIDFLIASSPRDKQELYRHGLDRIANANEQDIQTLLAPLQQPWAFEGPSDPFARFLIAFKDDVLHATVNSREWAEASPGRRGARGIGTYWYALD